MLLEIILDYDNFKNSTPIEINHFKEFFNRVIPQFYETEKNNMPDLLSMNRKFLQYIIMVLDNNKKTMSNVQQDKPLFTIEEIKGKRQSQFEEDLEKRQMDFSNAMKQPIPERPKFADGIDKPLDEMDVVVKRTIAQRNMEMNQIYNTNIDKNNVEKWLTPAETSIKPDKKNTSYEYKNTQKSQQAQQVQQDQQIRYIKIDKENIDNSVLTNDIIDLDERQKLYDKPREKKSSKQIKWGENDVKQIDENIDIFKYLKKVEPPTDNYIGENTNILNQFESLEKIKPPNNSEYSIYIEKRFDEIQDQIKNLNKTLESHMDRCNNTLTILYNLLTKRDSKQTENEKPENPQSAILM